MEIYLIYPIYPFLLTAQTAGAIELQSWGHNILVKISKKEWWDGPVPMLGASMTGQVVWLGCKRVFSVWPGSGIYKSTLNFRCNSVELLPSLLALGQDPQRMVKSFPVGRAAWEVKGISDAGSRTEDGFGGNIGAMKILFSLSRPQAHPAYKFAE